MAVILLYCVDGTMVTFLGEKLKYYCRIKHKMAVI